MSLERPDLSQVSPDVKNYIEALEAKLEKLQRPNKSLKIRSSSVREEREVDLPPLEPDEPPTPFNVITISTSGLIKRTPRHLYSRQRRGGMGVFDLETAQNDSPALLAIADVDDYLFCLTNKARTFRLRLERVAEAAVRSKGQALNELLPLHPDEHLKVLLPERQTGHVVVVTDRGFVRRFRYHYFGENLKAGRILLDKKDFGSPVAGFWSVNEEELLITTQQGKGIRFAERQVPARGCLGIRLAQGDIPVGIVSVNEDSGVFLITAEGKGTIRQMTGFRANKAPGSGGKVIMKTDSLVGAATVDESHDVFAISQLSKIIRFQAKEVPPKDGVVQGVNCMSLRADEVKAVVSCAIAK